MKKLFFFILFIALIVSGFVYYASQEYPNDTNCVLVAYSENFKAVDTNVYVSNNTPQERIDSLLDFLQKARQIHQDFWGEIQQQPTVIFCNSTAKYKEYGVEGTPGCARPSYLNFFVVLHESGLNLDVIAHELCHAEIFERLGGFGSPYLTIPCWFDEGVALQFDNRAYYSNWELGLTKERTLDELKEMDTPEQFYLPNKQDTKEHYLASKKALTSWLEEHSKEELIDLLEAVKNGADVYEGFQ